MLSCCWSCQNWADRKLQNSLPVICWLGNQFKFCINDWFSWQVFDEFPVFVSKC
jgi:hypothetical protein